MNFQGTDPILGMGSLSKLFFALDEYGQNDIESLFRSQLQRCREQGTTEKTDYFTVPVGIKKTEN